MAKLTDDEVRLLRKLQRKAEAPDAPPVSRTVNVSIDLGDEKQVERATRLGLLEAMLGDDDDKDDKDDDDETDDDDDKDDAPRRKGFFGDR